MNPRFRLFLLALNLALCALLAVAWTRAHRENRRLSASLSHAQSAALSQEKTVAALRQKSALQLTELARLPETPASSRAPEIVRRELALQAIARLKQSHAQNPPPPLPKRPPRDPNSGFFFTELMSDPEYSRLAFLSMRLTFQSQHEETLRGLGLPPATSEKIIDLLAGQQMAWFDYRQLLGDQADLGNIYAEQKKEAALIDEEIRALMTPEQYSRFSKLTQPGTQEHARHYLASLAQRLSYTDSPLDTATIDRLAASLAQQVTPDTSVLPTVNSEPFAQAARSILTPAQHTALLQLQAEWQAKRKRSQLPATSQIPRL